jgi:hypothetical protein
MPKNQDQAQGDERDELVRQAQQLGLTVDPDGDVEQLRQQIQQERQQRGA